MAEIWNETNGIITVNLIRFLLRINQQIAWRFISSAVMISPFILLIIALRGKFSPNLRSRLLGACLFGLLLPYQRSAFHFFDNLYPLVRKLAQAWKTPDFFGFGSLEIFEVVSVIWLGGFLFFLILRNLDYKRTLKLLREKKWKSCCAYFYRFRSRIYLPPDFNSMYTPEQQEMLLAHERQHIAQHDPLIYRLLAVVECVCWFNPLVSVAVRHFQHERELLCDEKATQSRSKYEYGMLILKAAETKPAVRAATAGIVMEFGSISERVNSLINPVKTVGKQVAAVLIFLTAIQLATGLWGFRPSWMSADDFSAEALELIGVNALVVYEVEGFENLNSTVWKPIEELKIYAEGTKDMLSIDELGLYEHARSLGLTDESCLLIQHVNGIRPEWGSGTISTGTIGFELRDLKNQELFVNYRLNQDLYTILTDIFI